MKKQWQWIILLSAVLTTCAVAGELVVREQAVSGIWQSGTVVQIYGRVWVAAGTQLKVEPGVEIVFHSTSPFRVEGMMTMQGSSGSPIILDVAEGWLGFKFSDPENSFDWNTLEHVIMSTGSGLAETLISSENSRLRIWNCVLQANSHCLNISGGRLNAVRNSFLTYGTYSSCVKIAYLDRSSGVHPDSICTSDEGNRLVENLIQVDGSQSAIPGAPYSAYGLYIDGSTDFCIDDNKIQLYDMPGTSCGMYFGFLPESGGGTEWKVRNCVIKVTSENSSVACVKNLHEGDLTLARVTMDAQITDPDATFQPVAVVATGTAFVQVNSDIVVMSSPLPAVPWLVDGEATINIQYSLRWYENNADVIAPEGEGILFGSKNEPSSGPDFGNYEEFGYYGNLTANIYESPTVITDQPPMFARIGEEGIWTSHEQVALYYGLTEESPCRDAGDPLLDEDPDETIADIGRYYFHADSAHDVPPIPVIPSDFAIQCAYPNPFNPVATIPFTLSNPGNVRVAVYNLLGRDAGILMDGRLNSGQHTLQFNGALLASGVYLVSFEFNGATVGVQRLILLK